MIGRIDDDIEEIRQMVRRDNDVSKEIHIESHECRFATLGALSSNEVPDNGIELEVHTSAAEGFNDQSEGDSKMCGKNASDVRESQETTQTRIKNIRAVKDEILNGLVPTEDLRRRVFEIKVGREGVTEINDDAAYMG